MNNYALDDAVAQDMRQKGFWRTLLNIVLGMAVLTGAYAACSLLGWGVLSVLWPDNNMPWWHGFLGPYPFVGFFASACLYPAVMIAYMVGKGLTDGKRQ